MRRAKFRPTISTSTARRSAAKPETKTTEKDSAPNSEQNESPKKPANPQTSTQNISENPEPVPKPVATPPRRRRSAAVPNLGRPRARSTVLSQASNGSESSTPSCEVSGEKDAPGLSEPPPVTRLTDGFARPGKSTPAKSPSEKPQSKSQGKSITPVTASTATVGTVRPTLTPSRDRHSEKRIVTPIIHDRRRELKDIEKEQETPAKRRKRYVKTQPPDRSKMTMSDLIYYNPKNNPMKSSVEVREKKKGQNTDEDEQVIGSVSSTGSVSSEQKSNKTAGGGGDADNNEDGDKDDDDDGETEMPVPQVRISDDGTIVINEASLFVDASPKKTNKPNSEIVYERASSYTTSASFRKRTHTATWTERETAKFYKALSTVGTDFTLVNAMFPFRTRTEIKNKFKREERINRALVDKAIRERQHFDMSVFEQTESDIEAEKEKERKKQAKTAKKQTNRRKAAKSKTGEESQNCETENGSQKDGDNLPDGLGVSENLEGGSVENGETGSVGDKDGGEREEADEEKKNSDEGSDEEIQIVDILSRPTRSGRQPKLVKSFTIEEEPTRKRRARDESDGEKRSSQKKKKANLLQRTQKQSSDFSGYSPGNSASKDGGVGETSSVGTGSPQQQHVSVSLESYVQQGNVTLVNVQPSGNSDTTSAVTYIIPAGNLNAAVAGNVTLQDGDKQTADRAETMDAEPIECQIITTDEIPVDCDLDSGEQREPTFLAETVVASTEYDIQTETYPESAGVFIPPSQLRQTTGSAVTNVINIASPSDNNSDC